MASVSLLDPYFNVSIDARPSNYLINHVSWSALNEVVNWSEIRLVRNTTGFPQNINDGVTVFKELSDSIQIVVGTQGNIVTNALYMANPIATFTYSGGGTVPFRTSDGQYLYYTAVAATGGTGSGAKFDVIRSRADGGNIVSIKLNSPGSAYTAADTLTLSTANTGIDSAGNVGSNASAITITVSSLGTVPSNGIKAGGFTVVQPNKTYTSVLATTGAQTDITTYNSGIAGVTTGLSTGNGATFSVSRNSSGVYTVNLVSAGSGYKTGDIIRIPGSALGGRASSTVLGQTSAFHVFDGGTTPTLSTTYSGITTNPGYGKTGTPIYMSYNPTILTTTTASKIYKTPYPKYFYSVFVKYTLDVNSSGVADTVAKWKNIATSSSFVVTDGSLTNLSGQLERQSTLKNLLSHLPAFYTGIGTGVENSDLKTFLSLFAFHLDCYSAASVSVSKMTDPRFIDDKLIDNFLKQLGSRFSEVNDVKQARVLLNNLIRNYQNAGSSTGVADYFEAYTGYATSVNVGTNLMPDYNSSSFLENIGSWYPDAGGSAYLQSAPYTIQTVLDGPLNGTVFAFANTAGVQITGCSSVGNVITCDSTVGLTSGVAITKNSGTGTIAVGTVVTSIVSTTAFKVSQVPTVALSGAVLYTSTNLTGGMMKITGTAGGLSGTTDAKIVLGPRRGTVVGTISTSSTTVVVRPNVAQVDDFVIGTGIPYGTYVTAIDASANITLSNLPTTTAATTLTFAKQPMADLAGASTAMIAVQPAKPYSFAVKTNTSSTVKTTAVALAWYDVNGTLISTSTSASSPATLTSPGTNQWGTAQLSAISPVNAAYMQPSFTMQLLGASTYWADAAQIDGPIQITSASVTSSTATVTSAKANNYKTGNFISVTGMGAPYDGTFLITATASNITTGNYSASYAVIAGDSTSTVNGYMASANNIYEDARTIKLTSTADRINYMPNPSFESSVIGTTGWSLHGGATIASRVTPTGVEAPQSGGTAALQVTIPVSIAVPAGVTYSATGTPTVPVVTITSGETYTFSSYFYLKTASATEIYNISVTWIDSSNNALTSTSSAGVTLTQASGWARDSFKTVAPSGATHALVKCQRLTTSSTTSVFYLDSILVEQTDTLKYYFDGSFDGQSYEADRDTVWESTIYQSPSHLYRNLVLNSGKIDSLLTDVIYLA